MKIAIDNKGRPVEVPDDTTVRTVDGVHYLLTDIDRVSMASELVIREAIANDRALVLMRQKRDALLSECDWTMGADTALTPSQIMAWKIYRQKLRDIPSTYSKNPKAVVWPPKP